MKSKTCCECSNMAYKNNPFSYVVNLIPCTSLRRSVLKFWQYIDLLVLILCCAYITNRFLLIIHSLIKSYVRGEILFLQLIREGRCWLYLKYFYSTLLPKSFPFSCTLILPQAVPLFLHGNLSPVLMVVFLSLISFQIPVMFLHFLLSIPINFRYLISVYICHKSVLSSSSVAFSSATLATYCLPGHL